MSTDAELRQAAESLAKMAFGSFRAWYIESNLTEAEAVAKMTANVSAILDLCIRPLLAKRDAEIEELCENWHEAEESVSAWEDDVIRSAPFDMETNHGDHEYLTEWRKRWDDLEAKLAAEIERGKKNAAGAIEMITKLHTEIAELQEELSERLLEHDNDLAAARKEIDELKIRMAKASSLIERYCGQGPDHREAVALLTITAARAAGGDKS